MGASVSTAGGSQTDSLVLAVAVAPGVHGGLLHLGLTLRGGGAAAAGDLLQLPGQIAARVGALHHGRLILLLRDRGHARAHDLRPRGRHGELARARRGGPPVDPGNGGRGRQGARAVGVQVLQQEVPLLLPPHPLQACVVAEALPPVAGGAPLPSHVDADLGGPHHQGLRGDGEALLAHGGRRAAREARERRHLQRRVRPGRARRRAPEGRGLRAVHRRGAVVVVAAALRAVLLLLLDPLLQHLVALPQRAHLLQRLLLLEGELPLEGGDPLVHLPVNLPFDIVPHALALVVSSEAEGT
mmetsp:Transcript_21608/g.56358  ORF Transcript_21608/g.56358 Transcript_21608/m.56358 type:complete len:299 (+) Transcript_21608:85-981(+)